MKNALARLEANGRIFHFKERNDAERYIRNHYNIAPRTSRWDGDF